MFALGFDVAKDHHDVALTNKSGQLKQRWQIANTSKAISELLTTIHLAHPKLTVGCEATGSYQQALLQICLKFGIPCRLLNPLATKVQQHIHALRLEQKYLSELTGTPAEDGFSLSIVALEQLTADLRRQATRHIDPAIYQLLTSLVGIGPAIAVSLSAEIGDIHRFLGPKQLVAYAGLDPRVRQSGTVLNRNTRLTKRGSAELRHSLFLAANIARQHDPELKAYYQKKRAEGRTYTAATVATARKVCYRVFAVLSRGTPYIKST